MPGNYKLKFAPHTLYIIMKSLLHNLRIAAVSLACLAAPLSALAFPQSKYATQSQLASGRWVKIAVAADGVYELTQQELQEMGFTDIDKVRVWGQGGHAISETLNGSAIDDLQQVSSTVINGKLCFYGKGPVGLSTTGNLSTFSIFTRSLNVYSTMGYYFLSEVGNKCEVPIVGKQEQGEGTQVRDTSCDYFYHEVDSYSYGRSGKDMLGENLTKGGTVDFTLPQVADSSVVVSTTVGAKTSGGDVNVNVRIGSHGTSTYVPFDESSTRIAKPIKTFNYYNSCSPIAQVRLSILPDVGRAYYTFGSNGGSLVQANLDFLIISYKRRNIIDASEQGQMRMAFPTIENGDLITLPGAAPTTVVWNVTKPEAPVGYELTSQEKGLAMSPLSSSTPSMWVAFDPAKTLMKISSYQAIDNQNLHGMPTPGMLIITNKTFLEQAQRIAQMHATLGDVEVAVVDQEQVFNEFSSGTPDAMAYRLMCKMLYDRDKTKFKYLLLVGEGSYDNRGLSSAKPNRILTYQTDNSINEDYSYTTDDFFAMLDDETSFKVDKAMVRLGVGRIPSATVDEARSDIDKLVNYVLNPDYGVWRNNTFYSAETGDNDMHQAQAELMTTTVASTLKTAFELNKVYIDMFPRAVNETAVSTVTDRTSSEARRALVALLNRGQFYGTYIGHAGHRNLTTSRLWTNTDASTVTYERLPIFMSACCDVARYDSDQRGICEHMFHNPKGGAIALLTSTREVYANSNDQLNQAWTKALFNYSSTGSLTTLGEAYMKAKQSFGSTTSNPNKLKFALFGDPAMKVNYPRPLISLTEVNGTAITTESNVTINPLEPVTVKAQVKKPNGNLDDTFTGDATLTIYDKQVLLKSTTYNGKTVSIYYPRDILVQVQGRVENGLFTGTAILPRYTRAVNEDAELRIYAHKDGTDEMVNCTFSGITIGRHNAATAIADNQPPSIVKMYLNDEETTVDGAVVPANSTLYIQATDDYGINNQSMTMGNNTRLVLDGGKVNYDLVGQYTTLTDNGRTLNVAFPMSALSEGEHSLSFTVHDVAGNSAQRTISFSVGNTAAIKLTVEEVPAIDTATINATSTLEAMPAINLKVTDALGNIVWTRTTSSFPVTWNLTDNNGARVKGGLYKVYGTCDDDGTPATIHAGTNVAPITVITPLK